MPTKSQEKDIEQTQFDLFMSKVEYDFDCIQVYKQKASSAVVHGKSRRAEWKLRSYCQNLKAVDSYLVQHTLIIHSLNFEEFHRSYSQFKQDVQRRHQAEVMVEIPLASTLPSWMWVFFLRRLGNPVLKYNPSCSMLYGERSGTWCRPGTHVRVPADCLSTYVRRLRDPLARPLVPVMLVLGPP